MILPRFSLQQALYVVLIAGIVSIVLASAWQGEAWAKGQALALFAGAVVALFAAVAHWLFFLVGILMTGRSKPSDRPAGNSQNRSEEVNS